MQESNWEQRCLCACSSTYWHIMVIAHSIGVMSLRITSSVRSSGQWATKLRMAIEERHKKCSYKVLKTSKTTLRYWYNQSQQNESMLLINPVAVKTMFLHLHRAASVKKAANSLPHRAPARPSRVTCQVKLSPLAFSASSSFWERGNTFLQSSSIFGRW